MHQLAAHAANQPSMAGAYAYVAIAGVLIVIMIVCLIGSKLSD